MVRGWSPGVVLTFAHHHSAAHSHWPRPHSPRRRPSEQPAAWAVETYGIRRVRGKEGGIKRDELSSTAS